MNTRFAKMNQHCNLTVDKIVWENLKNETRTCLEDLRNSELEDLLSDLSSLGNFNLCDPLKQSDQAEYNRCSVKCIDSEFEDR